MAVRVLCTTTLQVCNFMESCCFLSLLHSLMSLVELEGCLGVKGFSHHKARTKGNFVQSVP